MPNENLTLLDKWNDPKWRSWAKLYSEAEYREAELGVALAVCREENKRLKAQIQQLRTQLVNKKKSWEEYDYLPYEEDERR